MKEEKNILNLYLSKVAAGDKSCLAKLVRRLADRLLFIPVLEKSAQAGASSAMTVNVYRHQKLEQEVIPVFTSEKNMEKWSVSVSTSFDQISVLGADLCTALGGEKWISIDEGSDHEVVFNPEVIVQIAGVPSQEIEEEDFEPILLTPQQIVPQGANEHEMTPAAAPEPESAKTPAAVSRFQDWD